MIGASEAGDKADEALAIAKGRNQAHVFATTEAMQTALADEVNKGVWQVGDNLYIEDLDVPDWWIAAVLEEADADTGYFYRIAQLETQKVDLTEVNDAIAAVEAERNLITYTNLAQIGMSTNNTLDEVIVALPLNSILDVSVATMTNNLTNSLPVQSAGRLIVTRQGNEARGVAIYTRYADGITWMNPYYNSAFVGWDLPTARTLAGLTATIDDLNLAGNYHGTDTTAYDDMSSMVLGVHSSLGNHNTVCKNFKYGTNTALVIGNRYAAERGRYLVMVRTNNLVYTYQIKDDSVIVNNILATTDDIPEVMTGATTSAAGTAGLVPAPTADDVNKLLRGDGTWALPALYLYAKSSIASGNTAVTSIQKKGLNINVFVLVDSGPGTAIIYLAKQDAHGVTWNKLLELGTSEDLATYNNHSINKDSTGFPTDTITITNNSDVAITLYQYVWS